MSSALMEEDALSTSFEPDKYTLYKRRWLILLVLSLLQTSNAMIWLSYAPIADYSAGFYETSTDSVNYLSLVYMVASALFGIVSAFILDYMGLRAGIIVGAWLNFLGAGIKFFGAFTQIVHGEWLIVVAFIGQSIAALAQPYMMFATTKLAALWFPDEQRALANTIGSMANPLGIMLGSLIAPAIVKPSDPDTKDLAGYFQLLLGLHCIPAGIAAVLSVIVITSSRPPTPPSASADEVNMPFVAGVKKIFSTKSYIILMISCGAGISLFTVLTTFLQQILCPRGYSDSFAGLCGALMIACGIVGAGITGVVCDKTKKFEEVAKTFYAFAVVAGCLFSVVVRYPGLDGLVAFSVCMFGFFGFGLYPICLELGVEVTYPVAEATSSAFIIISGQVQGILFLVVMQLIATDIDTSHSVCSKTVIPQDFTYSMIFFIACAFVVASLLIIGFKANYKRMRAEQAAAAQKILTYTSSNAIAGTDSSCSAHVQ